MAGEGGFSDYQATRDTGREAMAEENAAGNRGWGTLGAALGGGAVAQGQMAEEKGELLGSQTITAMAQARERVMENQNRQNFAALLRNQDIQSSLKLTPAQAELGATAVQAGGNVEQVTNMLRGFQSFTNTATVSDPNAPGRSRLSAAMGLHPEMAAPRAVGTAGSYQDDLNYDPDHPGPTGPVHISPQQSEMNQSIIGQRNASAEHLANLKVADNGDKLRTGMQWVPSDNDPTLPKMGDDGHYMQQPNMAAGTSAVSRRYAESVQTAASLISREVQNIRDLGPLTTRGASGVSAGHGGIYGFTTTQLSNALSSTSSQEYERTTSNIGRSLAMIENAGRMPPGTMTGQLDKLKNEPTSTEEARLYNLALVRQIVEAGGEALASNPDAGPAIQQAYKTALASVQKSIPWTPRDVIDFGHEGGGKNFGDFLKGRGHGPSTPAAAPAAPASKGGVNMPSISDIDAELARRKK